MSVPGETITIDVPSEDAPRPPSGWRRRAMALDAFLERAGDRLNPLLVKETRQALKSRQFLASFGLMLAASWLWSVLGLVAFNAGIYTAGCGDEMFMVYSCILAFPLLVVVPFGAYRSLAAEREDNTYELLAITAMGPRQMIAGKLASAMVQMLIYLSAVAPCIVFCYILRGIDLPTILIILAPIVLTSLGFSMIGLLAATLVTGKAHQTVLTVLITVGLFGAFWGGCAGVVEVVEHPYPYHEDSEFWIGMAATLTAYFSYFALVFEAAVARLGFASDNRSTRLRIVMIVQHVLLAGWMGFAFLTDGHPELTIVFMMMLGIHWYVMGAAMIGEMPGMSRRAMRSLPRSFLGRVLFSWLNPGPGTGYILALCGILGGIIMLGLGVLVGSFLVDEMPARIANRIARWHRYSDRIPWFCVLVLAYATIFLGAGLLIIRAVRRRVHLGIVGSVILQVVLVILACVIPAVLDMSGLSMGGQYWLLHVSNPFWTMVEVLEGRVVGPLVITGIMVFVLPAAVVVFALNLPAVIGEIRQVRVLKPERVARDDALRAPPPKTPPVPKRTSPWDED
ncbi:MAG: hypothetical protein JW818_22605 [Pirellulales bacterium]|nr:hypothetical protein [Pirellulales bacterium]